jgi:Right handed beta helix region
MHRYAQLDSRCTVVNSTIRENGTGGLFYSQGAEGLAEGNLIERSNYNGINITARANRRIRRDRIQYHRYAGILV